MPKKTHNWSLYIFFGIVLITGNLLTIILDRGPEELLFTSMGKFSEYIKRNVVIKICL